MMRYLLDTKRLHRVKAGGSTTFELPGSQQEGYWPDPHGLQAASGLRDFETTPEQDRASFAHEGGRKMKLEIEKDWCIRMAHLEGDAEIGAGRLAVDPVFDDEAAPAAAGGGAAQDAFVPVPGGQPISE